MWYLSIFHVTSLGVTIVFFIQYLTVLLCAGSTLTFRNHKPSGPLLDLETKGFKGKNIKRPYQSWRSVLGKWDRNIKSRLGSDWNVWGVERCYQQLSQLPVAAFLSPSILYILCIFQDVAELNVFWRAFFWQYLSKFSSVTAISPL